MLLACFMQMLIYKAAFHYKILKGTYFVFIPLLLIL